MRRAAFSANARSVGAAALTSSPGAAAAAPLFMSARYRLTNSSILSNIRDMADEQNDLTSKMVYLRRRQQDAVAFAVKEKEILAEKAKRQLAEEDVRRKKEDRRAALIDEAEELGGPSAADTMRDTLDKENAPYRRSIDAFSDKSVRLQHSFSGLADNRIIQWWEFAYWNYIRYFFTQELLIAKDRFGNKFTVTWQFIKGREEQRRMYRKDSNKKHQPYGALATDERLWERWMRGHRGDPPSVAEEEYNREYKKQFFGPMVLENEEVEDSLMRIMAHLNRSQQTFQELDDDQVYGDAHRATKPMREMERRPGEEATARGKKGATWTLGFVRGDVFYNEEEAQVMRKELGHLFRNMEWQELEYKRQVRMNKQQHPRGKPAEGTTDPNAPDGDAMTHYWERTDLGIPHHDAVPDLTTPELERLRIEADQLEDERWAIRKELGLTDLGDIREGRDPIAKDNCREPFQPPPVSSRWKPKCWEETWGTGSGLLY
ncbi:hypothetical protein STCU_08055 [Strigomonas culicis]|uniref:Uncharacterized protein n=1 Tax=Strigomonas culicis TaxID=28005 RepID=S9U245_9TRYP|nr:hypothetical protein STCU_08055 [Strigomonas culicis]|eukprot:EPY22904.1 hypothetical protein STCU_08055 [Strigomonas culicis]